MGRGRHGGSTLNHRTVLEDLQTTRAAVDPYLRELARQNRLKELRAEEPNAFRDAEIDVHNQNAPKLRELRRMQRKARPHLPDDPVYGDITAQARAERKVGRGKHMVAIAALAATAVAAAGVSGVLIKRGIEGSHARAAAAQQVAGKDIRHEMVTLDREMLHAKDAHVKKVHGTDMVEVSDSSLNGDDTSFTALMGTNKDGTPNVNDPRRVQLVQVSEDLLDKDISVLTAPGGVPYGQKHDLYGGTGWSATSVHLDNVSGDPEAGVPLWYQSDFLDSSQPSTGVGDFGSSNLLNGSAPTPKNIADQVISNNFELDGPQAPDNQF